MKAEKTVEFEQLLEHEDLIFAYHYWCGLCGDRDVPQWRQVDPLEIIPILPYVNLIDVVPQSDGVLRFRHRLLGTELVERFHAESTGDWFEDLYTPEHLKRVLPDYETPVLERHPVFGDVSLDKNGERVLAYRRLIMPLSGEDGSIERLMAIFAFDNIPDTLRDRDHSLPLHRKGHGSNVSHF